MESKRFSCHICNRNSCEMAISNYYSQGVSAFHDRTLPEPGLLVGYALLITELEKTANVPLPDQLAIVTEKHQRYDTEQWKVFTARHRPSEDLMSHLSFALKHEGIDLYILKKFFPYSGPTPVSSMVEEMVHAEATSQYARRVWFLYEWLMGVELDIPELKTGTYTEIFNQKLQYAGPSTNSTRHRVKNNLPGTPEFCPMARKTAQLEAFTLKDLSSTIENGLSKRDNKLVRRIAAFLPLKDCKASFAIEGESPPNQRARNWGRAIRQGGKKPLTVDEIERLQNFVIGSKKLEHMGIRKQEGFIGEHDDETENFDPTPSHISAESTDLPSLIQGLIDTDRLLQGSDYDPVHAAATIAFGFVFIHPLSDGNGRIHRYLIHHILTQMGYTKRDMTFPVSAAILGRLADYETALEAFSIPRLDLIEWEAPAQHNVNILNDTIDIYRYYDVTRQVEFLYECVAEAIETIIPRELDYLEKYDQVVQAFNETVTLPDKEVDLLIEFLDENRGKLSKAKRKQMFSQRSDKEASSIEKFYALTFPST